MRSPTNGMFRIGMILSSMDKRRWPSRRIIGCRREVAKMTVKKK